MFKRLMIFAIAGLLFVLGANYLLIYTINQRATRELERQDNLYWKTFNTIQFYGQHPDQDTERKVKDALDEARQKGLSKKRQTILQDYFQDLERCYQGDREACKKADTDMSAAIKAPR